MNLQEDMNNNGDESTRKYEEYFPIEVRLSN